MQGQKVLRDYNIAKEANGTGKEKIEVFNDTYVNIDGTLEIHLQWGGKGTHAVPHASVYGPLISAISITPSEPSTSILSSLFPNFVLMVTMTNDLILPL